jgi:hypothetical protein
MSPLPKGGILAAIDKSLFKSLDHLTDRAKILIVSVAFFGQKGMQAVMEIIIPLGIQAMPPFSWGIDDPNIIQIAFRNDEDRPV